jgi:hypothetical protein
MDQVSPTAVEHHHVCLPCTERDLNYQTNICSLENRHLMPVPHPSLPICSQPLRENPYSGYRVLEGLTSVISQALSKQPFFAKCYTKYIRPKKIQQTYLFAECFSLTLGKFSFDTRQRVSLPSTFYSTRQMNNFLFPTPQTFSNINI